MVHIHADDPFLAELIDEVLAPHRDLGAAALAEMRAVLELVATTHPTGADIVDRARPRGPLQRSGDQASPAAERDGAAAEKERERGRG
jgi:hypothetical protein